MRLSLLKPYSDFLTRGRRGMARGGRYPTSWDQLLKGKDPELDITLLTNKNGESEKELFPYLSLLC